MVLPNLDYSVKKKKKKIKLLLSPNKVNFLPKLSISYRFPGHRRGRAFRVILRLAIFRANGRRVV